MATELTRMQMLLELMQKAINAGWKDGRYKLQLLSGLQVKAKDPKVNNELLQHMADYIWFDLQAPSIIFNHDFAKTLFGNPDKNRFGDMLHSVSPGLDDYGSENCSNCGGTPDVTAEYCWQYHLQQAVIAGDPIVYLYKKVMESQR